MVGVIFLVAALGLSGCEPLRKKFIRQKKKEKGESMETLPILEPLEYPEKVYSPEDLYKQHYSLWQAWYTDLLTAIDDRESTKREIYNLNQAVSHLEAMKKLLATDQQPELQAILRSLEEIREDLKQPQPFINLNYIRLELESVGKKIRRQYRFIKVKESLVKPGS